jgi:hypothetical protein
MLTVVGCRGNVRFAHRKWNLPDADTGSTFTFTSGCSPKSNPRNGMHPLLSQSVTVFN